MDVFNLTRNLSIEFECLFQAGAFLKYFAAPFLIGPKGGIVDQFLQLIQLPLPAFSVKETSGRPRCES
jgi:hypothetical protein